MKNSSQKREQNEKKKEALNEYLEALKVVDYWTGKVRELNGAFIYRSPSSNTELPTKAIGNPTVSVSMEMETAEENEREAQAEVRKNGMTIKATSASGKEYDKENPAIKAAALFNKQKLTILRELDLRTDILPSRIFV